MAQTPRADPGKICPLHNKDMADVCHTCPWWTQLRGAHPQTGADIDEWGCAIAWLPMLMIETAKEARGAAAATESLRNQIMAAAGLPNGHPRALEVSGDG
jgi:hypothetical protein